MSLSLEGIRPARPEEWDDTWQSCGYATYLHSREWAEIWSAYTKGSTCPAARVAAFSDGLKALPLSRQTSYSGAVKRYISSPAGTFGGWISKHELKPAHARLLSDYLTRTFPCLCWRLNPYDPLAQAIPINHAIADETQTCNLEGGFDTVYRLSRKGHRQNARKAIKLGVTVRQADTIGDWNSYYEAYQDSLRRWVGHVSSQDGWDLFEEMYKRNSHNIKTMARGIRSQSDFRSRLLLRATTCRVLAWSHVGELLPPPSCASAGLHNDERSL